jgi:deoxyadenosine/deoxycytidine kinase
VDEARYICIEGPIGAGKSTLARILAERSGSRLISEPDEENPFLARFYADERKFAFQTQLFYLLSRFQQQSTLTQGDLFRRGIVCDYLFAKDRIFAALTLDEQEFRLYDRVYSTLHTQIPRPDLVIYLQARPEVLAERVKKRGRKSEQSLRPGYLEEVGQAFNQFFFHYSETPLLVVNTSDIDFEANEEDREPLLKEITRSRSGIHHYIPLGKPAKKEKP